MGRVKQLLLGDFMGEKEYAKMELHMQGLSYILSINRFLRKFRLGSNKIDKLEGDFTKIKSELTKLHSYPKKYTEYFSPYGFVAYSSIDFTMMEKSVNLYEEEKIEESIVVIREHYSADKIEERFLFIRNSSINPNRIRLITNVLEDYKNEKYYSVIPVLLMMIDGIIADIDKYGMHSQKSELSTWDMFEAENLGLKMIKDIFSKSRKKTTIEKIPFPYRNGILHGRDLGYDTEEIAILSWAYLFAVIDFVQSKKSEKERQEKYIKDNEKVSFRELYTDIQQQEEVKKKISKWKARIISDKYVHDINSNCSEINNPECVVIEYLNYFRKSNFGMMVKNEYRTDIVTDKNYGLFAKKVKEKFSEIKLENFEIISVEDTVPAITVVTVELDVLYYGEREKKAIEIRCIIQAEGKTAIHGDMDGVWKIMPFFL